MPQAQLAVIDADWKEKHVLYSGTTFKTYGIDTLRPFTNVPHDESLFMSMVANNQFHKHDNLADLGFNSFVVLQWSGTDDADIKAKIPAIYDMVKPTSIAVAMTGNPTSNNILTCIIRKRTTKPLTMPSSVAVDQILSLKVRGKKGGINDFIMEMLWAVVKNGPFNFRDFQFEKMQVHTLDTLDAELKRKKYSEIEDEIMRSKSLPKKARSSRDHVLLAVGHMLLQRRQQEDEGGNAQKILTTVHHYAFNSFSCFRDLICKSFDTVSGENIRYPLTEFLTQGHYSDTALVLMGDSTFGKTELAKKLCQVLASKLQVDEPEPFYVFAGTIDSLRSASHDGLLRTGVPVIIDDITPGEAQGSRPPITLENLKKLLEVLSATSIHARCKDIHMQAGMPRIITTNSTTPKEWHFEIPQGILDMDPVERFTLDPNVKAIFKRCTFCLVTGPLYSMQARQDGQAQRRARAGQIMADVFSA